MRHIISTSGVVKIMNEIMLPTYLAFEDFQNRWKNLAHSFF